MTDIVQTAQTAPIAIRPATARNSAATVIGFLMRLIASFNRYVDASHKVYRG